MRKYTTKGAAAKRVVYPGIAAWLARKKMTVGDLARLMGYEKGMTAPLYYNLYGQHEPNLHTIRKILAATGMTFEEAFGGDENAEA